MGDLGLVRFSRACKSTGHFTSLALSHFYRESVRPMTSAKGAGYSSMVCTCLHCIFMVQPIGQGTRTAKAFDPFHQAGRWLFVQLLNARGGIMNPLLHRWSAVQVRRLLRHSHSRRPKGRFVS